jgi:uncharacterized protein (DUF1697 family)
VTTFVALLRGVNVGRAQRLPMEAFRSHLCSLGYANVKTLLNSGNAVFSAATDDVRAHAAAIARRLAVEGGLLAPVMVKSARELAAIIAENPFANLDLNPSRILVAFAAEAQGLAALESIAALAQSPDRFHLGTHAAYAYCKAGSLASPVGSALLGKQGTAVTTRNWATTLKIHDLARTT